MRRPLHWFLVSSALSLSSWSLFATATPENLTSNDSYDGSKTPPDPETFTARETSNEGGTTYTLTGDVFFKNITKAVSPVTTGSEPAEEEEPTTEPTASAEKSCFSNTAGPLTFTGNNHSLTFENISLTNEGASVSNKIATTTNPPDTTTTTATALSFEGFSSLSFTNAPAKVAETTTTEGDTTVAEGEEEGEEEPVEEETPPPTANGAIFVTNSTGGDAKFSGNTSVTFKSNSNVKSGGAISAHTLEVTGTTKDFVFENNSAEAGGAVCVSGDKIVFSGNTQIRFVGNICEEAAAGTTEIVTEPATTTAPAGCGGALCTYKTTPATPEPEEEGEGENTTPPITGVSISDNGHVTFANNKAPESGGAIYTTSLDVKKTSAKLLLEENSAKTGGAVCVVDGNVSLSENASIVFKANEAKVTTIAPETPSEVTSGENGGSGDGGEVTSVSIITTPNGKQGLPNWKTTASSPSSGSGSETPTTEETTPSFDGCGGAICCHTATTSTTTTETTTTTPTTNGVTLTQNPDVTFDLNSATADGGAIYATTVTATGNGNITFSNNTAGGLGGAIYTDTLDINTTTTKVTFENNSAEAGGAAYVAQGKASLTNNASVVFSGNKAEVAATPASETSETASPDSTTSSTEPAAPSQEGSVSSIVFGGKKKNLPDWSIKAEEGTTTTTPEETTPTTTNLGGCGGAICCYVDTKTDPAQPGVSLSGNTSIIFDGNSATASGGAIYGSKITTTGNGAVTFSENTAKTGGAVHVAGGDLSLSNNTSITFSGNTAVSATTPVTETTNVETPSGTPTAPTENAAVSSIQAFRKKQTQLPNWSILATEGDETAPSGDTTTTTTSEGSEGTPETVTTTALTETTPPNLDGCGGAICCYVETTDTAQVGVTLSGNTSLIFDGNSATASGGAIYGTKITASGNKAVTFSNNTATTSGGAIHAKTLIISAAGTTTFSNNSSAKGGAINIEAGGTLTLEAISGDIIFEGNTTKSTDGTVVPNSIHLGDGATMIMRANSGHTIYFYDPITIDTTTGETAPKIIINAPVPATPASESPVINSGPLFDIPGFPRLPRMSTTGGTTTTPTGTVVFSGEKLTEELAKNPAGATSTINQDVELQNGSLEIKDGATIAVKSLTQNSDSMIIMDAGTTLKTISTAEGNTDGALTITNLAVNIDSITPTSKPITIAVNSTSGKLALSGDLNYYSESGSYENPALGHDFSIPLFNFAGEGTINTDGFSMTPAGDLPTSSGYQGQWVLKPVTADGKTVFIATWEAAGYTPLPERNAFLLPNSLWNITRDALAIQEIIATTINNETSNSIWAAGLSNFFHRSSKKSVGSGFRYISGGYVFGGNIEIPSGNSMGIALAQLFGKAKDYSISDVKSRVYAGTLYAQHSQPITIPDFMRNHPLSRIIPQLPKEVPSIMKAQLTYARANNDMKTKYESATQGESKWHDHCLALEASNYMPVRANNRYINTYSPFVKVQLVYANQTSCQEVAEAAYVRDFSTSHLINLSVPMGIVLEKHSENSPHSFDLTLTYNMDLYRDKPSLLVSMPATGVSWTAFATNLARQGLQAQAASHHKLGKHFEVCTHGGCELRSSSRSYNADCGGKYFF